MTKFRLLMKSIFLQTGFVSHYLYLWLMLFCPESMVLINSGLTRLYTGILMNRLINEVTISKQPYEH